MPIFKLTSIVSVSAYTNVEAETLELAIAEAEDRQVVLGGHGSGESPDESWIIEDADGTPKGIEEQ